MAALGSLVAGVAHELNTPIGNIVMVASTQQEKVQQFEQLVADGTITRRGLTDYLAEAREGADLILQSVNRAAVLIQNFKQVAVDQAGDRLRSFDLASQTAEVLAVIAHLLAKSPVNLEANLEPGIDMKSYPGPLGQVLTNLVLNAVNHAGKPARAFSAGRTLAAGFMHVEITQPLERLDHAARVIQHDHCARTQHRPRLGYRVIVHRAIHHDGCGKYR